MYIDEVGNTNTNHRYLSLMGLVFEEDYVAEVLHPALEELKRQHFGHHPDMLICLTPCKQENKRCRRIIQLLASCKAAYPQAAA